MPNYTVTVEIQLCETRTYTVTAFDEDDAKHIAEDRALFADLLVNDLDPRIEAIKVEVGQ